MQINSRVSTVITLNQGEIEEAVIDFVRARAALPTDAKFKIEFDDAIEGNDLTATVNVDAMVELDTTKTNQQSKPTTTRAPRTPRTTPAPTDEKPQDETPAEVRAPMTSGQASRPDKVDPPFDVDTPQVDNGDKVTDTVPATATIEGLNTGSNVDKPVAAPVLNTTKIFGDTATSAPPIPAPAEDPVAKAKSLFAHLSKPTN